MRTFGINTIIGGQRTSLMVQEESIRDSYVIKNGQKFVSRIYRNTDGNWKSYEVSDLSPADINSIGTEIEAYQEKHSG